MKDNEIVNNKEKLKIIVCMGSACFARGNNDNLGYIEKLIEDKKLDIKLELSGLRCEKNCEIGPNVIINGNMHNKVKISDLDEIFSSYFLTKK